MLTFTLILLGVIALGLLAVAYRLLRYPYKGLSSVFDTHALGRLERSLPFLKRVIVIATKVEDPQNELRKAVKANFNRGVRYLFLISKSTARDALNGYYQIFQTLARIEGKSAEANHLVDIQELPYDWLDYPYVFYELREPDTNESSFVAFRGNQQLEGIADLYSPVTPRYAHTIASAVLSGAPQPIAVRSDQFKEAGKLLAFSQERHQEQNTTTGSIN